MRKINTIILETTREEKEILINQVQIIVLFVSSSFPSIKIPSLFIF